MNRKAAVQHGWLPPSSEAIADIDPLLPTSQLAPHRDNKCRQQHRNNQTFFKVAVVVVVRDKLTGGSFCAKSNEGSGAARGAALNHIKQFFDSRPQN
jgi:hypothetical protein